MAIETNNLRRTFGDFVAVDDVSFHVPDSQVFGFLGPNGAGKTTTIRMLLGLLRPSGGEAYVLGRDVREASRALLGQIGYVSQQFSLYTDLTVEQNLKFFGRSYGLYNDDLRRGMAEALDIAGLRGTEDTRAKDLAGGWAQRLALAAAIMHKPRLLFLDEPTAGVDPVSRREFWDLLYRLAGEGTTLFVTTHYMDEAEHCESVAFIYRGRLIGHDAPHDIIEQVAPGEVVAFEPADPATALEVVRAAIDAGELDAQSVDLFGAALHILTANPDGVRRYLETQMDTVENLHVLEPSLEDAFIALLREA